MGTDKAFSIIEILFVLVIFSIMLSIAGSYGGDLLGRNSALVHANRLRSALRFARFSAIKQSVPVLFCGSSSLKKCDGGWQDGQIIITDSDSNKVLRVFPKISGSSKIVWWDNFVTSKIRFLPTGFIDGSSGSFYCCPGGGLEHGFRVILNVIGRVRVSDKNSRGETISCNF